MDIIHSNTVVKIALTLADEDMQCVHRLSTKNEAFHMSEASSEPKLTLPRDSAERKSREKIGGVRELGNMKKQRI